MTTDENGRVYLTNDEALAMLPDDDQIHTFRQGPVGVLIGADWDRSDLVKAIKKAKPELTGEIATKMKHGMVIFDAHGPLFIKTKEVQDALETRVPPS